MNRILLLILGVISTANAQVGIGTTNPQQELHVSGTDATIRVDGLNAANNVHNDGTKDAVVYANGDGDLILKSPVPESVVDLQGGAIIPNQVRIFTNNGSNSSVSLASGSFNLDEDSWVISSYEVVVSDITLDNVYPITDGFPRLIILYVYIDGNLVSRSSHTYTSSNYSPNGNLVIGRVLLKGTFFEQLSSGNHTYELVGAVYGGSYRTSARFGGFNDLDRLQILRF